MNLYCIPVPAGKLNVTDHSGLLAVYCEAESAMALAGDQLPRVVMLPTIWIVCPTVVVTSSLKVTATDVGEVQAVVVEVVAGLVVDAETRVSCSHTKWRL